jgi:DUF917 family protein
MTGIIKLSMNDLRNIVQGATVFGSGGGGSPRAGNAVVSAISRITESVSLLPLEEVPDEAIVAATCGFGSPEVLQNRECVVQNFFALETLERVLGKKIDCLVPFESGGYNSLVPFYAAALKGIPVIDCDGTGRAVCEWYISMFEVHRIPMSPFALADDHGHSAVIYGSTAIEVDRYARAVLREFGLVSGTAGYVMSGAKARAAMVPNMISMERALGAMMTELMTRGQDPLEAVLKTTGGFLLIDGSVAKKEVRTSPIGSDHGLIQVEGYGRSRRRKLSILLKNESILARWSHGLLAAMLPDIITYLDHEGRPITNADIRRGVKVRVLGIPIHTKCRDPRAIPLYQKVLEDVLGCKESYVPVEELQTRPMSQPTKN